MSRKRVIRLKQAEGLTARVRKRFKRTTMSDHDQPIAANVLGQAFVADAPNQRWVGDTTEFVYITPIKGARMRARTTSGSSGRIG